MASKGKNWRKPCLIILAKSQPQEAVLAGCKYTSVSPTDKESYNGNCTYQNPAGGCAACSGVGIPS